MFFGLQRLRDFFGRLSGGPDLNDPGCTEFNDSRDNDLAAHVRALTQKAGGAWVYDRAHKTGNPELLELDATGLEWGEIRALIRNLKRLEIDAVGGQTQITNDPGYVVWIQGFENVTRFKQSFPDLKLLPYKDPVEIAQLMTALSEFYVGRDRCQFWHFADHIDEQGRSRTVLQLKVSNTSEALSSRVQKIDLVLDRLGLRPQFRTQGRTDMFVYIEGTDIARLQRLMEKYARAPGATVDTDAPTPRPG